MQLQLPELMSNVRKPQDSKLQQGMTTEQRHSDWQVKFCSHDQQLCVLYYPSNIGLFHFTSATSSSCSKVTQGIGFWETASLQTTAPPPPLCPKTSAEQQLLVGTSVSLAPRFRWYHRAALFGQTLHNSFACNLM